MKAHLSCILCPSFFLVLLQFWITRYSRLLLDFPFPSSESAISTPPRKSAASFLLDMEFRKQDLDIRCTHQYWVLNIYIYKCTYLYPFLYLFKSTLKVMDLLLFVLHFKNHTTASIDFKVFFLPFFLPPSSFLPLFPHFIHFIVLALDLNMWPFSLIGRKQFESEGPVRFLAPPLSSSVIVVEQSLTVIDPQGNRNSFLAQSVKSG